MNGVKLADILFSLLSVCLSDCVSVRTQSSLQQCVSLPQRTSHLPHGTHVPPQPTVDGEFTWRIYALSERLLFVFVFVVLGFDFSVGLIEIVSEMTYCIFVELYVKL